MLLGWGAGQLVSVLVTPTVGIRPTLYRPAAWMASLYIRDADLIFAGNAYPALTRTPFWQISSLASVRISSAISIWWAHKDSNLGPAD